MKYGMDLIRELESEIAMTKAAMQNRAERIDAGMTDYDDCFISARCDERALALCNDKIALIRNGGTAWFTEYATLGGQLVNARWCDTMYGLKLRAEMPDGSVVWTTSTTKKGLARRGLKMVECKRPAWYAFHSAGRGMMGVYAGQYVIFPSDINYATGEDASVDPLEIRDAE